MNNSIVTVTTDVDYPLLHADRNTRRVLEITVTAHQSEADSRRLPINCALVIDRSGSMGAKNKLGYAQRAAHYVIDQLCVGDALALVAYDDQVEVLMPSRSVDESSRRQLHAAVDTLHPGNSTGLHAGWHKRLGSHTGRGDLPVLRRAAGGEHHIIIWGKCVGEHDSNTQVTLAVCFIEVLGTKINWPIEVRCFSIRLAELEPQASLLVGEVVDAIISPYIAGIFPHGTFAPRPASLTVKAVSFRLKFIERNRTS